MRLLEECELFMDILEGIVPFESFIVGYSDPGRLALVELTGNELSDELIRNEADNHCDGKRSSHHTVVVKTSSLSHTVFAWAVHSTSPLTAESSSS
jgi:hypothetical protein